MAPPRDPRVPDLATDADWDAVDQAAWESFPASDPPSFGSSHAAPTKNTMAQANEEVVRGLATPNRRNRRIAAGIGIALIAMCVPVLVWRFRAR